LLVFSRTDLAYQSLKTQFFKHTVGRVYTALVRGTPGESHGHIETRLVERTDGKVHSTRQKGRGILAVTDWTLVTRGAGVSLLLVHLRTGRKHQIRTHLAERGMPIVGDTIYGPPIAAPRLMLAATRLEFDHPRTGERVTFEIDAPEGFLAAKAK